MRPDSNRDAFKSSTSTRDKEVTPAYWGDTPVKDFKRIFGELKPLTNESFFRDAFANGASTHSSPLTSNASVNTWPGIWSFDTVHLNFQRELAKELDANLKVTLDKDGFTSDGMLADFGKLHSVAGYVANPMSYVAVDNTEFRKGLGLKRTLDDRERAIFKEVFDIAFAEAKLMSVNVTKLSSGGMRRHSRDLGYKLAYAEWLYEPENLEGFLNAVQADDHLKLANEYETIFALYMQKRLQVDAVGKPRKTFDLAYARSGGLKGKIFDMDKSVVIDGVRWSDFSAMRPRNVQAGPWTVNCLLQVPATCVLHSLFERFPTVFHVNTPTQLEDAVRGNHVFCSDVTEYDRTITDEMIVLFHEAMAVTWDERLVKASLKLFRAPYYSKPLARDGRVGAWVGDPRNPEDVLRSGNRSGHAMTSLINKLIKVAETLCVISHQMPVLGRVSSYLSGQMPLLLINNGDDEVVHCANRTLFATFVQNRTNKEKGQFDVKPEAGSGFSGMLLTRRDENDTNYKAVAKIHTVFEKMWIPERSIGGKFRQFWTVGAIDRISNISKTDVGRQAWEIHMSVFRRTLAPVYGDFMSTLMREHSKLQIKADGLSSKDKEVLDDPSKLHYKFSNDEISSSVRSEVTSKIPKSAVHAVNQRLFRGKYDY